MKFSSEQIKKMKSIYSELFVGAERTIITCISCPLSRHNNKTRTANNFGLNCTNYALSIGFKDSKPGGCLERLKYFTSIKIKQENEI